VATSQTTVLINDFGLQRRTRVSDTYRNVPGAGRKRYTIQIKSEPIAVNLDPRMLGKPVADEIARSFKRQIEAIADTAKPSTIRRRAQAREALLSGDPKAFRRYSGGRTLNRLPGASARLFNDSGRLANSVTARATKNQEWVINIAANRFDPKTFNGGEAAISAMVARLSTYVPALRDARLWFDDQLVAKKALDAIRNAHGKRGRKRPDDVPPSDWELLKRYLRLGR